jgi:hypothetical protein
MASSSTSTTAKKVKTPLDQRVKDMVDEHLEKEEEDHIIDENDDVYMSESDVSDHDEDGHHDDDEIEIASMGSEGESDDDDDIMLDFETGRVKSKKMLKGTKKKGVHEYEDELEYDPITPGEERFIRHSG